MTITSWGRFIVRVEILSSSEHETTYGFDLTSTSIFVVTEWRAATGTAVSLRLSFPKSHESIDVEARISDLRVAGEPGEPAGIRLVFDAESSDVVTKLVSLLERCAPPRRAERPNDAEGEREREREQHPIDVWGNRAKAKLPS